MTPSKAALFKQEHVCSEGSGDCQLQHSASAPPSEGDLSGALTAPTTEADRRERQRRVYAWLLEPCLTEESGQYLAARRKPMLTLSYSSCRVAHTQFQGCHSQKTTGDTVP